MLCHYMLFYGMVGKATRERGCCMPNVGVMLFSEKHSQNGHVHLHTTLV